MCGSNGSVSWWLWMGGSIAFAVAAMATALSWSSIINAAMASMLVLSPTSQTYHRWVAPDQPLYFEIFMFNWTNAKSYPKKPKLEQLGPYRFREVRKHVDVKFHPHNSSVAYRTQRTWYFDSITSNGSLEDIVTSLDMVTASTMYAVRSDENMRITVNMALIAYKSGLSVTKTVGEMLFDGYEDPFQLTLNIFAPKDVPRNDRFGWFYKRNNSIDTDGYMEVSTGAGGSLLGQILKWNHQDTLPYFKGSCAKLAGSAGEFMPRNLTDNSTLTMFVPDLCRTVNLDHVDSGVMEGLDYNKFEMLNRCFDTENTCFCNGPCEWSGVMNVSACWYNAPAFLSLPHFLHADPRLRDAVDGMAPDHDKHSFYMSIESTLGVPIDVAARFQFNVHLPKFHKWSPKLNDLRTLLSPLAIVEKDMMFPVFWVQQHVKVTDNIFTELRVVNAVVKWGGVVLATIGLACLAFTVICSSRKPKYIIISGQ